MSYQIDRELLDKTLMLLYPFLCYRHWPSPLYVPETGRCCILQICLCPFPSCHQFCSVSRQRFFVGSLVGCFKQNFVTLLCVTWSVSLKNENCTRIDKIIWPTLLSIPTKICNENIFKDLHLWASSETAWKKASYKFQRRIWCVLRKSRHAI